MRCGAVDDARECKPSIPTVGEHGIPIHDERDLCRFLDLSTGLPSRDDACDGGASQVITGSLFSVGAIGGRFMRTTAKRYGKLGSPRRSWAILPWRFQSAAVNTLLSPTVAASTRALNMTPEANGPSGGNAMCVLHCRNGSSTTSGLDHDAPEMTRTAR